MPVDAEEATFEVGDYVDCCDTVNKWCVAMIQDKKEETGELLIHYEGWSDKWNEWIKIESKRVAM